MRAWIVRAGESGARDTWCLENGYAGGGWAETPDLTGIHTEDAMQSSLQTAYPNSKTAAITNYRSQLWRLTNVIKVGDLVALPLKSTKEIALGLVTGTYEYRSEEPDFGKRHLLKVDWERTDLPRTAVGQDLLYSLGAFMTICEVKRNDAVHRLEALMRDGKDPGARITGKELIASQDSDADQEAALTAIDIEQLAYDTIVAKINEKFLGHDMARLVAAILTCKGFQCEIKPPGPDGGVDILAGAGPLGLDSPKIVVQVKSQNTQVGDEVIQTLQGALARFGADQALLVAWGGVNKNAANSLSTQKFRIRVWESDDLIQQLLTHYEEFPEALRNELPLKQVWTLVPTGE